MAKFSDLPQELRDMIWELAIRPEGPTAHYLSVHHLVKDSHLVEPHWTLRTSMESSDDEFVDFFVFAAPRCGRDDSFSWVLGNHSTYMEDSALWTTCRDSRNHMIRRFRPYETNRRFSREHFWKTQPRDVLFNAATVTAVLQRDGGEQQYFTIQPMRDLIIIQVLPDSCISWDREVDKEIFPPIDDLWDSLPWNNALAWRSQYGVTCWPRNIAIEFDPKWLKQPKKYIRQFRGALDMKKVDTLWFIDDRLQRDPEGGRLQESIDLQKDKKVFNATGRRFIELHACDPGWRKAGREAFDFVDKLEDIQYLSSITERGGCYPSPRCSFGVLACELL